MKLEKKKISNEEFISPGEIDWCKECGNVYTRKQYFSFDTFTGKEYLGCPVCHILKQLQGIVV